MTVDQQVLTPGTFGTHKPGPSSGPISLPKRFLVFGTALTGSDGPQLAPTRAFAAEEGHTRWGNGGMLGGIVEAILRSNAASVVDVIAMPDDGAGVQAAANLDFTGTATAAGTAELRFGGVSVKVAVASGDAAVAVVAALAAADTAVPKLPVTLAVGDPTTRLVATCKWDGATGNSIAVEVISLPPDISVTTPPSALSGGATDPDLNDGLGAVDDEVYSHIIVPYTDDTSLDAAETWIASRWGGMAKRRGIVFVAYRGAKGAALTWAEERGSQYVCAMASGLSPTPPWVWAASVAAARSLAEHPVVAVMGARLPYVLPPPRAAQFNEVDRNELLTAGLSTHKIDASGNVVIERLVTCYTTDSNSAPDDRYRDVVTLERIKWVLEDIEASVPRQFNNVVLVSDANETLTAFQVQPSSIGAYLGGRITGVLAPAFDDPVAVAATLQVSISPVNPAAVVVTIPAVLSKPFASAFITLVHS